MPLPRLLVVEGNTAEGRALFCAAGGAPPSESYAKLLRELLPDAIADICFPADGGANLPDKMGLEGYDGIVITGSSLNMYDGGPAIDRQIELIRTAYTSNTPLFGSCWGLQLLTTAAGGVVRKNPKGREVGFGRRIAGRVATRVAERLQGKLVGKLSGGERGRLHLAKTLALGGNVLMLDEPSNDLDVETLRALEEALVSFAGCAVVISHDRWFLDRIATHVLAFEGDSQVRWFEGNFQDYEAWRRKELGVDAEQPKRLRYKPLVRK